MDVLAPELLAVIFSFLDEEQLAVASRACSRWRSAAHDHPNYWQDISLSSSSMGSLDRARHRINAGADRVFNLRLDLSGEHDQAIQTVLDILRASLHRLRELTIKIHETLVPCLWDVLLRPAPALTSLRLTVSLPNSTTGEINPALTIPVHLFHGDSPRLRKVLLRSILLPDDDVLAFANVLIVAFVLPIRCNQPIPMHLFRCFPRMQSLQMAGGRLAFGESLPQYAIDGVTQLRHLDVDYREETITLFRALPIASLPSIVFAFPTREVVYTALETLRGPMEMHICHDHAREFRIACASLSGCRSFAEDFTDYEDPECERSAILGEEMFPKNLSYFLVASSLWAMLNPYLPRSGFRELEQLCLHIDNLSYDVIALPTQPLACPKLTLLCLQAKYDFALVAAEDVVAFANRITYNRVQLELARVVIVGPRGLFEERFSQISAKRVGGRVTWGVIDE